MKTYYLVGLKEKSGAMIAIYDSYGNDKPPDPLSTRKDEAMKYRDYMQKLYPDEKYCCLKAEIIEEEIKSNMKNCRHSWIKINDGQKWICEKCGEKKALKEILKKSKKENGRSKK